MRSFEGLSGAPARAGLRRSTAIGLVAALTALLGAVGTAKAAVVFDAGPGTGSPPTTLGPYTVTPFPPDQRAAFEVVDSVPSRCGRCEGDSRSMSRVTWRDWTLPRARG